MTSRYSSKTGSPRSMMKALSDVTLSFLHFRIVSNSLESLQRAGYGQWAVVRAPLCIALQGHISYKHVSRWLDSAARVLFIVLKALKITTDIYRTKTKSSSCNNVSNANEAW